MRLLGVMSGFAGATMVAGALLFAAPVQAQQASSAARGSSPALTAAEAQRAQQQAQNRPGLEWNRNGRWGLNLDLDQPAEGEADWGEVEAGAYYRINPRLSVGASAGLAAPRTDPTRPGDNDRRSQPRVRLETIFRF